MHKCIHAPPYVASRRSLSVASYEMAPGIKAPARQVKASAHRESLVDGDSTFLNRLMNRYWRLF